MENNNDYYGKGNSTSNKSCTLVIKGEKDDLKSLITSLEKIGLKNDTQWNEARFSEYKNREYFIMFHHFSDFPKSSSEPEKITVFSEPSLYSLHLDTIVRLKYKSEIKEMVKTVNKFLGNKFRIPNHEKITIGGYEIEIKDKNTTTISGFYFTKDFWESAYEISSNTKALVKIGCNHQIDLDITTISKVLEMLNKKKK